MKGKLFLIHWNASEAEEHASALRSDRWSVNVESQEGTRAGNLIRADPPDVVVIYLTRLPSHGRETARHLRSLKTTRDVPILFVDGKEEAIETTRAKVPEAVYVTSAELGAALEVLSKDSLAPPQPGSNKPTS